MEQAKNSQGFNSCDLGDRGFIHLPVAFHRMSRGSYSGRLADCAGYLADA